MTGKELLDSAKPGFVRLRFPQWASPNCYMRLYVTEFGIGPWGWLFDRKTQEAIGEPTPQTFPTFEFWNKDERVIHAGFSLAEFHKTTVEPYGGELDEADAKR